MELLLLIVGIVALWKFSSSINLGAEQVKAKAEVMSEKVIADCALERQETYKDFLERKGDTELISHDRLMQIMRGK
jgi:hypothetical protein